MIVDSSSTDATMDIIAEFDNASVFQREFDNHTIQWNFGIGKVASEWSLAMDADYRCTQELTNELKTLEPTFVAYAINVDYAIYGKRLRSALYPPRVSLFKTSDFKYIQDGHTQLLDVSPEVSLGRLKNGFLHDDRKGIDHWVRSQCNYAELEAEKLHSTPTSQLSWKDRLRRWCWLAPCLTLFYCLFAKLLILDGWPGIFYSLQRVFAELILSLKLIEKKLNNKRIKNRINAISLTVIPNRKCRWPLSID